jgi:PAS domain S-box-containing protein
LTFSAPIPDNDAERLATLASYGILDTAPEQAYDDVTALATYICGAPYSTVTFVDRDRQWFKSEAGFGTNETARSDSFCAFAILRSETLIVEDTLLDPRFSANPFVLNDPKIRFYAGSPIVAPNGHVLGTVCVFDDKPRRLSVAQIGALESLARQVQTLLEHRTAISRLEVALATSRDTEQRLGELAAIVDSSDDAILSKNLNGIITSWNFGASRIFGYSADEMVGESILKLIPEELHSDETLIIGQIRKGERVEHFETVRLTKDGRRLNVALTVSPVRDERGNVIGASKILRDISARKKLEESLLQSEKIASAGRMASTIAHEVNNPLEAITNLLYLLRPLIVDTCGLEYLATAESEIARVSHIAKQTLGFYREHTAASLISVSELVQQTVMIYEPRCAINGINMEKSLRSTNKVLLRRGEMMQVISNLISNSMYAMPSGGILSVSTEDVNSTEHGVVISVRDTGVGILSQNIPKVFEAFFTTRSAIGTGIGLFVAKQFVEGHGGRIELESSVAAPDHGTTVRIHLPLQTSYDTTPTPQRD